MTSDTTLTGALAANGGITCDGNKFTVADTSGNTSIGGTLAVTSNTTLTGALAANGGIACETNLFTVAAGSGNTAIAGTLQVSGDVTCSGNFTVNGQTTTIESSNLSVTDTLIGVNVSSSEDVTGNDTGILIHNIYRNASYQSNVMQNGFIGYDNDADKFTLGLTAAAENSTGNLSIQSLLTVEAPSGNTAITGSFTAAELITSSDRNLKDEIRQIEDCDSILESIQGVRFKWKSTSQPSAGVIAQDVETLFSEAVTTDETGKKSVNYNCLIGVLVECVKAQKKMINQLDDRLKELEQ